MAFHLNNFNSTQAHQISLSSSPPLYPGRTMGPEWKGPSYRLTTHEMNIYYTLCLQVISFTTRTELDEASGNIEHQWQQCGAAGMEFSGVRATLFVLLLEAAAAAIR